VGDKSVVVPFLFTWCCQVPGFVGIFFAVHAYVCIGITQVMSVPWNFPLVGSRFVSMLRELGKPCECAVFLYVFWSVCPTMLVGTGSCWRNHPPWWFSVAVRDMLWYVWLWVYFYLLIMWCLCFQWFSCIEDWLDQSWKLC
jgi:hypothetical protein